MGVEDTRATLTYKLRWTFRVVGAYVSRRIMPIDAESAAKGIRERERESVCVR